MVEVGGKPTRELEVEPTSYRDTGARLGTLILVTRHLLRGGARVALRVAAPQAAIVLAAAFFLGPGFLESVREILLPREAGVGLGPAAVVLLLLALARALHARLRSGDAYLRSLPIGAAHVHRARILAAAAGVAPLALLLAALLAAGASTASASGVLPDAAEPRDVGLSVLGLLVAPVGVAVATAPAFAPRTLSLGASALGLLGALLVLAGHARGWLGGTVLVAAALLLPARAPAHRRKQSRRDHEAVAPAACTTKSSASSARASRRIDASWVPLPWLRAVRSIGTRRCVGAFVAPLLCFAATLAFTRNNELSPATLAAAWRLGGGCAVAWLLAALANELQRRRAPWSWSRSLPRSARHRVLSDAALLGSGAVASLLPFAIAAPLPALLTATAAPYLSVRAAAVASTRDERFAGAVAMALLLEGSLLAGASALVPWLPTATLVLLPFAVRAAAAADRATRVSRRTEIHASDLGAPSPS